MKTKLITLLVGLVLPLASTFAGEATTAAAGGPIVIGMSVAYLPHPFFRAMADEAEREAAKLGVKIVIVDAKWDSFHQKTDLENFVSKDVQGILVAPKDAIRWFRPSKLQ